MTVHQWLADWSSWGWPLLANHLWQATLLSIAVFAAAALLKNAPGRARYAVWLIASVKFALPSALVVSTARRLGIDFSFVLASTPETVEGFAVIYQLTSPLIEVDKSISARGIAPVHSELFCVLTVMWFTGCILLLALWWMKRRRFRSAMRVGTVTSSARERLALSRVRSWLCIRRDVGLLLLPGTIEPGVWGMWRPVVLLPASMAEELSDAELEAVVMHELIHVARWDNLTANLHRLLCCVLWFHPVVWMLDRLLLAERERACDEEVIRLGGAADVYASSLVKVLRFCLGWSVAGASNATGSNLGRRVEQIMSGNVKVNLSVWYRAAVGSIAALVIILSMASGFLTREAVVAQSKRLGNGVKGESPGGVQGVPGGNTGFAIVGGQDKLFERLDAAPLIAVEFKNSARSPLVITDARVKAVPRVQNEPGDEYAVLPVVAMMNNSDRRIKGFTLEFRNGVERRAYYERMPTPVDRGAVYTSGAQKRFIILVGGASGWTVRVAGVLFEDDDVWGVVPAPPPPPPPPPMSGELMRQLEEAPDVQIQFESGQGAPILITSASGRAVKANRVDPDGTQRYLVLPNIQLMNNTGKRVIGFWLEFAVVDSKHRTYVDRDRIAIEPFGSYSFRGFGDDGTFTAVGLGSSPDRIVARVIGVRFENGEVWGYRATPVPPPRPQETLAPEPPRVLRAGDLIRKSGGVMMASATLRVEAAYPALARAARISGTVVVEVTVDEAGAVISARAISGHPLLKDAAVAAASQWLFSPTTLAGVAVRVIGTLSFNFEP